MISAGVAHAPGDEVVVQQQRALARRRRALERGAADADDGVARRERRDDAGEPLGTVDRVELVAALGQAGRGLEVVVGAERDDEDVGLVGAGVGRHAPRLGIDRRDRLLQEPHARLGDLAVRQAHRVAARAPEHHVELREAEDERVALVDQRHVDLVAERLRERGGELEPAEARAEDEDAVVMPRPYPGVRCTATMPSSASRRAATSER